MYQMRLERPDPGDSDIRLRILSPTRWNLPLLARLPRPIGQILLPVRDCLSLLSLLPLIVRLPLLISLSLLVLPLLVALRLLPLLTLLIGVRRARG